MLVLIKSIQFFKLMFECVLGFVGNDYRWMVMKLPNSLGGGKLISVSNAGRLKRLSMSTWS
jgi:hypothetical protein